MSWRLGIVLALVIALLGVFPAYAIPPGGDDPDTAVELNGMKIGDTFYFDTKSGALKAGQEAFYKIYDRGTNNGLGVTFNYRPWTPEAWPSATLEDPAVMFAVWTPVWSEGRWKLKEVGDSTPSAQPSGVKYWRGGTNIPRTYYFQVRNYGPNAIDYAIAFTGPLYPPPGLEIKPAAAPKADIVDTAVGAGSFKTLVAAVQAAGLVGTLKGPGPFTVLAPTDEAFAKLPPGTVETLLKPENLDKLKAILTYHVIPGRVYAETVVGLKEAPTVNGQKISISVESGKVKLNGAATVVKTDIDCANGVIHVIDQVILPK